MSRSACPITTSSTKTHFTTTPPTALWLRLRGAPRALSRRAPPSRRPPSSRSHPAGLITMRSTTTRSTTTRSTTTRSTTTRSTTMRSTTTRSTTMRSTTTRSNTTRSITTRSTKTRSTTTRSTTTRSTTTRSTTTRSIMTRFTSTLFTTAGSTTTRSTTTSSIMTPSTSTRSLLRVVLWPKILQAREALLQRTYPMGPTTAGPITTYHMGPTTAGPITTYPLGPTTTPSTTNCDFTTQGHPVAAATSNSVSPIMTRSITTSSITNCDTLHFSRSSRGYCYIELREPYHDSLHHDAVHHDALHRDALETQGRPPSSWPPLHQCPRRYPLQPRPRSNGEVHVVLDSDKKPSLGLQPHANVNFNANVNTNTNASINAKCPSEEPPTQVMIQRKAIENARSVPQENLNVQWRRCIAKTFERLDKCLACTRKVTGCMIGNVLCVRNYSHATGYYRGSLNGDR
ncbi:hypothetical protein BC938DRAFT_475710 [Jimgerdemannia flammicorona]|uniref:Uncharacterized protein n=1 Tax=Jimgerdemannia flammicorona TaxID=994334 RepID=A0A433PQ76_9FUNG|nr:hypothetical protein BC938DRAFT_475710 [Jimgerdemannia flammicorona]